jgi:hypothetical protein
LLPAPPPATFDRVAGEAVPEAALRRNDETVPLAYRKRLIDAGFDPMQVGDLEKTRAFVEKENERWIPIARSTGIQIN